MTNIILENRIINLIERSYGLRGQELALKVMSEDLNVSNNDILDTTFDMIERGELIEIECVFPNHVSKSFLVPRGTSVNVVRKR